MLTTCWRFRARVPSSQPTQRSRAAMRHAGLENCRAADQRPDRPRRKHQIAQVRAERDRVPEVVVASHQLPEQQALGGLAHPLDPQRLDVAHAAHERAPRLPCRRPGNAGDRTERAAPALVRQHQGPIRVEPLQELAAFPRLQPPIRAPPPQQLAHRARQLHPAQTRTVPYDLADQRHLARAEDASREPRRRHRHRQTCLPSQDTVPERRGNVQGGAGGQTEGPRREITGRAGCLKRGGWGGWPDPVPTQSAPTMGCPLV